MLFKNTLNWFANSHFYLNYHQEDNLNKKMESDNKSSLISKIFKQRTNQIQKLGVFVHNKTVKLYTYSSEKAPQVAFMSLLLVPLLFGAFYPTRFSWLKQKFCCIPSIPEFSTVLIPFPTIPISSVPIATPKPSTTSYNLTRFEEFKKGVKTYARMSIDIVNKYNKSYPIERIQEKITK